MNRSKSLIIALARYSGALILFQGLIAATYVGPFYHRYMIFHGNRVANAEATFLFWLAILQIVLRVAAGLFFLVQAGNIIESLCPKADAGLKPLIVAILKFHGFILLFYGVAIAVNPEPFVFNLITYGLPALPGAAPGILRVALHLLAGLLVVIYAERIIDWFEPRGQGGVSAGPAGA